jgi:hypothetical protein
MCDAGRYSHLLSAFSSRSQELQRSDDFQIPSTSEKTSLVSLCFTSLLSSSLARMRLGVHCRIHGPPPFTPRLVACFAPPHTSTTPSYHFEECHGARVEVDWGMCAVCRGCDACPACHSHRGLHMAPVRNVLCVCGLGSLLDFTLTNPHRSVVCGACRTIGAPLMARHLGFV